MRDEAPRGVSSSIYCKEAVLIRRMRTDLGREAASGSYSVVGPIVRSPSRIPLTTASRLRGGAELVAEIADVVPHRVTADPKLSSNPRSLRAQRNQPQYLQLSP